MITSEVAFQAQGQNIIDHSPAGYDTPRNEIKKRKVDTIIYYSKTVVTKCESQAYTTPSYKHTWPVRRNNLFNFAQQLFKLPI
jgi:hypothetical protein